MARRDGLDSMPLPNSWPKLARRAVLNAVSMASAAFVVHLERWANRLSPRARGLAGIECRDADIARLRERLRLIAARLGKVPPRRRPHYSPPDRLAILELRAAGGCGWRMLRSRTSEANVTCRL